MILYFCNKHFNDFLEHQMSKDKLTSLLATKMWNFYTILMQQPLFLHIVIFFSTAFIVLLQVIYFKSPTTVFKRKQHKWYLTKCLSPLSAHQKMYLRQTKQ